MYKSKKLLLGLLEIATIGFLVTSCGGGGGGSKESNNETKNVTIKGRAIDDPLANAKVCIDINNNSYCDENEPSTFTQSDGFFAFQIKENLLNKPIVVEATIKDRKTLLTRPTAQNLENKEYIIVSPFTTIVKSYYDITANFNSSMYTTAYFLAQKLNLDSIEQVKNLIFTDYTNNPSSKDLQSLAQNLTNIYSKYLNKYKNFRLASSLAVLKELNEISEEFPSLIDLNNTVSVEDIWVGEPSSPKPLYFVTAAAGGTQLHIQLFELYNKSDAFNLQDYKNEYWVLSNEIPNKSFFLYEGGYSANIANATTLSQGIEKFIEQLKMSKKVFKGMWKWYTINNKKYLELWGNADIEHTLFSDFLKLKIANKSIKLQDLFPNTLVSKWDDCIRNATVQFSSDATAYLIYSGGHLGYKLEELKTRPFYSESEDFRKTDLTIDDIRQQTPEEKFNTLLSELAKLKENFYLYSKGQDVFIKVCGNSTKIAYTKYIDIWGYPHIVVNTTKDALKLFCSSIKEIKENPFLVALSTMRKLDVALVPAEDGSFNPFSGEISSEGKLSIVVSNLLEYPNRLIFDRNIYVSAHTIFFNEAAIKDILKAVKMSCGW